MLNIQFIKVPFISSVTIDDYVESLSFGVAPSGEYIEGRYAVDTFSGYLTGFNTFFSGSGYWLASGNSSVLRNFLFDGFSGYATGSRLYNSLNGNCLIQGFSASQTGTVTGNVYLIQNYQQDSFSNYATGYYDGSFLKSGVYNKEYDKLTGTSTGNTFPYVALYNNSGSVDQKWSITYSPGITSQSEPFSGAKSYIANGTGYGYIPYSPSFLLGNYTAESWIYIKDISSQYPYLFSNMSAIDFSSLSGFVVRYIPSLGATPNRILFENRGAGLEYSGVASGAWMHIAVSRYTGDPTNLANSGSFNIFYNGVLGSTTDKISALSLTGRLYSQLPVTLGISPSLPRDSSYYMTGNWSEFRLWDYARSASEIQSTMNTKINPSSQTGLLLYLSL